MRILLLLIPLSSVVAQSPEPFTISPDDHTLTVYVIRSVRPLDWESPATLFKSYLNGFCSTILRKEKTMLGHLFIRLSTPLLSEPLYAGITNFSRKEMRNFVLKQKIGLAVLGTGMKARLQHNEELISKIEFYARKNELAFITYKITEEGASRIIDFYLKFIQKFNDNLAVSQLYGGAFWPLYHNEGAGCSAFGLAMLELAHIRGDETRSWKNEADIPMNLMGGKINQQQKIGIREMRKAGNWHSGDGIRNVDYLHFEIYDPTLVYNWILTQINRAPELRYPGYYPADDPEIPGLICDRCSLSVNRFAPFFQNRPDTNLFVQNYYFMTEGKDFK